MRIRTKILVITAVGCLLGSSLMVYSQNGTYSVDPLQSELNFKVSHLGPFKVKGKFLEYSGAIIYEQGELIKMDAEVMVTTIDTRNDERDEILRTEPYFDIEKFPYITYWADRLANTDNGLILHGRLKIKEVENYLPIDIDIDYNTGNNMIIISGETEISRKNYQLVFGSMNGLIGDKVDIQIKIVAIKQ